MGLMAQVQDAVAQQDAEVAARTRRYEEARSQELFTLYREYMKAALDLDLELPAEVGRDWGAKTDYKHKWWLRQEVDGIVFVFTAQHEYTDKPLERCYHPLAVQVRCPDCGEPYNHELLAAPGDLTVFGAKERAELIKSIGAKMRDTNLWGHKCWQATMAKEAKADPRNNPVLREIIREEVLKMFKEGIL